MSRDQSANESIWARGGVIGREVFVFLWALPPGRMRSSFVRCRCLQWGEVVRQSLTAGTRLLLIGCGLAGLASCDKRDSVSGMETGSARFAVTAIPQDVVCLRITARGSSRVTRSFDTHPGSSQVFALERLPLGEVALSAEAFATPCGAVNSESQPTWITDSEIVVTLLPNVVVEVSLMLKRPTGQADVVVDFEDAGSEADAGVDITDAGQGAGDGGAAGVDAGVDAGVVWVMTSCYRNGVTLGGTAIDSEGNMYSNVLWNAGDVLIPPVGSTAQVTPEDLDKLRVMTRALDISDAGYTTTIGPGTHPTPLRIFLISAGVPHGHVLVEELSDFLDGERTVTMKDDPAALPLVRLTGCYDWVSPP